MEAKKEDAAFIEMIETRYPLFSHGISKTILWTGDLKTRPEKIRKEHCWNWYSMSIASTGEVPLCCLDGEINYKVGDVNEQSPLEIYNSSHFRRFRLSENRHNSPHPCNLCNAC